MKLATALVVLAHVAFLYGCAAAISVHPVYTESDLNNPVQEPKIEGEWMSPDPNMLGTNKEPGPPKWKIDPPKQTGHPNGTYSVELRCPGRKVKRKSAAPTSPSELSPCNGCGTDASCAGGVT